jgi:hypothetical protein
MKYTAFFVVLIGVLIACFAGILSMNGGQRYGPEEIISSPTALGPILIFAFAIVMVLLGTAMWFFGGKGYTISRRGIRPGGKSGPRTDILASRN